MNKKITNKNKEKILFVIPAYNEEKNIKKVILDINENVPEADIVVINDCSTDRTKEIVENENVILLTTPFNMRYAKAVQTGLKFASQNNYDYVVQFDGDGQHLAKEAKKLIEEAIKTDADIVIGSRFLQKTDYKHPFFRRIGTKIFSFLIKILCNKKITDPTSGLQCLNKKVINLYSKMGAYPEFPDANLLIEMLFDGYNIREIPVIMKENSTGQSMHSGIIKPIKYMIKVFYSIFIVTIRHIFRRKK